MRKAVRKMEVLQKLGDSIDTDSEVKISLQPAVLDWRSPRVQLLVGMACIAIPLAIALQEFFACRFFLQEYSLLNAPPHLVSAWSHIIPGIDRLASLCTSVPIHLFAHHAWMYRTLAFVVAMLSAAMTGILAFEICGLYGRRIGSAQSLFVGLLILLVPVASPFALPFNYLPQLLSACLALTACLADFRYRRLHVQGYFIAAIILLLVSGALDARGLMLGSSGILLSRFCLLQENRQSRRFARAEAVYLLILSTCLAVSLALAPSSGVHFHVVSPLNALLQPFQYALDAIPVSGFIKLSGKLLPPLLGISFVILLLRALIGSVWLRPFIYSILWLVLTDVLAGMSTWSNDQIEALFMAGPFCLVLSLAALPCADALDKRWRISFTAAGSIVLSCIAVLWGSLLCLKVHSHYSQGKELSYFKIELARRLDDPNAAAVVVVNPPFFDAVAASENDLSALMEKQCAFLSGLLDSPLTKEKTVIRFEPAISTGTVRLRKLRADAHLGSAAVENLVWSSQGRQLLPIYYSGEKQLTWDFAMQSFDPKQLIVPAGTLQLERDKWGTLSNGCPYVEATRDGIGLVPGSKEDLIVWLRHSHLDPSKINAIKLICQSPEQSAPDAVLLLRGIDTASVKEIPFHRDRSELVAITAGSASWLENRSIAAIGLRIPSGSSALVLKAVQCLPASDPIKTSMPRK